MVARSRAQALSIQKYRSQPFFNYYKLPCKMFNFNILGPTCGVQQKYEENKMNKQ